MSAPIADQVTDYVLYRTLNGAHDCIPDHTLNHTIYWANLSKLARMTDLTPDRTFNRVPDRMPDLNGLPPQKTVVAFYNLENLYDTTDNPIVHDDEFIPGGAKKYNTEIYQDKLFKLATVLKDIGMNESRQGAALIGVAEIENDTVLYDLVRHFLWRERKYQFIHFDSKDGRGVDVALLYNPGLFAPVYAIPLEVTLPSNSKESHTTRDILYVKGLINKELIHIYVNHWPSRRGGEERSAPARIAAADRCRKHLDSVLSVNPAAKIIVMGDLNDNPTDKSIRQGLRTIGTKYATIQEKQLFNPWEWYYRRGLGTLANKDVWGLFDQILVSASFINRKNNRNGWHFQHAAIYYQPFMTEPNGRFKGYPMRTWEGNNYRGGFSDHFPTYIVLTKADGEHSPL